MANYRPKSLDELNNLYGKSMAAQNAIKKSGSAITADSDEYEKAADLVQQELQPKEKTASQIASDELSEALSGFIKNFGESDTAKDKPAVRQPLPITKAVKSASAPAAKKSTAEAEASEPQPQKAEKKEKPILMRNAERSELLDDYMKIMNDEDDDVAYLKNIIKKKKKSKKDKHQGSPLSDGENEQAHSQEAEQAEDLPEQEAEAVEETEEKEGIEGFYAAEDDEEQEEAAEEAKPAKKKKEKKKREKNIFLQIFFMLLLLAVLIGAVSLSALKIVTNADKNDPITDKYSLFTIDRDFEKAELTKGDLVITENKAVAESDSFAYKNAYGELTFAVKGTQIGTDRFMAHCDGEVDLIEEADVRGVIIKTIPSAGNIVKILTDNFIIIIAVLIAVALIIILILALAFRSKSSYEIDESEYSDASDTQAQQEADSDEQESDDDGDDTDLEDYEAYEDTAEAGTLFETID